MSAIGRLLDDYEAVAEAASRLLKSKGPLVGEHERCCEAGQCLQRDEAYIQAEADSHRALAKVAPGPFRPGARQDSGDGSGIGTQLEIENLRGTPAEYLQ